MLQVGLRSALLEAGLRIRTPFGVGQDDGGKAVDPILGGELLVLILEAFRELGFVAREIEDHEDEVRLRAGGEGFL